MALRSIPFLGCWGVLLVLASAALDAGGWAVITVKDLPDHVVVGKPGHADVRRAPAWPGASRRPRRPAGNPRRRPSRPDGRDGNPENGHY